MSLTDAQKKAIEDSNKFDWNNAAGLIPGGGTTINAGQGALTSNISNLPSFNFTGISTPQLGFNISGGNLPSGRSMGGLYSTFNPANPANKMNKLNEGGSVDESSSTANAKSKAKQIINKVGSRVKAEALATPLGRGIKGISGLVKKIKAKKASKQTENKEE